MENKNLWVTIYRVWNHFNWNKSEDREVEISARSMYDLTSKIDERVECPYGYSSIDEVQEAMDQLTEKGHLKKVSDDDYLPTGPMGLNQNFPVEYMKAGNNVLGSWCEKWKK